VVGLFVSPSVSFLTLKCEACLCVCVCVCVSVCVKEYPKSLRGLAIFWRQICGWGDLWVGLSHLPLSRS